MTAVLVIRPEPGCSATLVAARTQGLEAHAEPLFEVGPCRWDAPDPSGIDGLLVGSANAVRHAGPQLALFKGKPVHAVGAATLAGALARGLTTGMLGEGGLQEVICALPPHPVRLLRLAGAVHVALDIPSHVTLETRVVYAAVPLSLRPNAAALLQDGALVLLHSAAAARHFASECNRLGLPRPAITLAALGPRIAAAAGSGWADCRAADRPNDAALLALAKKMCH